MHSSDHSSASPSSEGGRGGRSQQKTLQLCAQVSDALAYALGDCSDPILIDLSVVFVEPLEGAAHLLVGVDDPHGHGLAAALAALDRARSFLRAAVAEQVARRKAPQLSFTLVPHGGAA